MEKINRFEAIVWRQWSGRGSGGDTSWFCISRRRSVTFTNRRRWIRWIRQWDCLLV